MIIYDGRYTDWTKLTKEEGACFFKGPEEFARKMFDLVLDSAHEDICSQITNFLNELYNFSAGFIETENFIVAWVDHIRSWPLYYSTEENSFFLSNNARMVKERLTNFSVDPVSCIEFAMSGYVAGNNTLYDQIKCMQPGEFLIWDKKNKQLRTERLFRYIPDMTQDINPDSWDQNLKKLGEIIDALTKKIISRADGRPIWVPLSGGLDSRLILCKLHEHGYKNISTFTYGPYFNFEAKIAKKVAKNLGVAWHFVSPSMSSIRRYFKDEERKNFWESTDGLKAISSMREFSALMCLREKKKLPNHAILINGQSGDYITGNHISPKWFENIELNMDVFYDVIFKKHYALWGSLNTEDNFQQLKKRIDKLISGIPDLVDSPSKWATMEEVWEYDARQICLVANGQRSYDFFEYDWEMPLWERELVEFCEKLPFQQKRDQRLYKDYLRQYNYQDLFPEEEPYIWRWPPHMMWVVPLAQIIEKVKGSDVKESFYALMRYHGHYSNQFYSFPWATHEKTFEVARNVMSLNVREWATENRDIFSEDILKGMMINHVD